MLGSTPIVSISSCQRGELEERLQDHEQRASWRTEWDHMFVNTQFSRPRALDEQESRWSEGWEARNPVQTDIANEATVITSQDQAGGQGSRDTGENNNGSAGVANANQGHDQKNNGLTDWQR